MGAATAISVKTRTSESPWFTIEEAAAYAKRSLKTMYNWSSEGKIPTYHPDGRVLVNKDDIDKYITSTRKAPAGE
jgi:excisionase family DNA binding protein